MAGDTLFTRRARLAEAIGISRSQTIPADLQTRMNGYVEDAIREITRAHEWDFMRGYERLEMEAAVIAGTVSTTAGSTDVVGVGTDFPTGWTNENYAEIRIQGESYRVASITDGTNLVLTDAALGTFSGVGYTLYKPKYLLTTVYAIEAIAPSGGARTALRNVGIEQMRTMKSNEWSVRHPMYWTTDSIVGGLPLIDIHPVPYDNEIMHVHGLKLPTIPSDDGDTDDIPEQWSKVVDLFALAELFLSMEDKRYAIAQGKSDRALTKMMQEADANRDGITFELDPRWYSNPNTSYPYGGYWE